MTRAARSVALLSALLSCAVPSAAQDTLSRRVSLDLKAMAPGEAFKVIATAIGYTVEVAPGVTAPVDILVRNVTAKTALNTICESIGCLWQTTGTVIGVTRDGAGAAIPGGQRAAGRGEPAQARQAAYAEVTRALDKTLPAGMKFENAPMTEVADRLSKATGFDITFSGDIAAGHTFTADLSNGSFLAALKALTRQLQGNVICRVGARRDSTGILSRSIRIEIGSRKPPK